MPPLTFRNAAPRRGAVALNLVNHDAHQRRGWLAISDVLAPVEYLTFCWAAPGRRRSPPCGAIGVPMAFSDT
jgi:hypothetical protein